MIAAMPAAACFAQTLPIGQHVVRLEPITKDLNGVLAGNTANERAAVLSASLQLRKLLAVLLTRFAQQASKMPLAPGDF